MGDCRRVATIKPRIRLMLQFRLKTQRGLLNYYYTSNNLTCQQLSGVGGENRTHFHGFAIQCLSNWLHLHISGTPSRNRTHIQTLEESCIIHYTMEVNFGAGSRNRTSKPKRKILSLLCLPISPYPQKLYYTSNNLACQQLSGTSAQIRTENNFSF